ncbi:MAG: AAA family ATPase [Pseudomonadota bacterium]
MSEHSKIEKPIGKKPSLLERANSKFGLADSASAKVPTDLPQGRSRVAAVTRTAATRATAESSQPQSNAPFVAPEKSVSLSGPTCVVDRAKLRSEGLIVPEETVTGLLEEFRIVKRELIADARVANDKRSRRILFSSPHTGEGKTYCAINLAIALSAERDVEVVLVDADTINPSIVKRLGIAEDEGEDRGLMEAIADPAVKVETLVRQTDISGLFVLPAGASSAQDSELLASARTAEVLDRLTAGAPNRFVVFDTPPALAASPVAELAAHVGQTVLVVRAGETGRAALEDAQQLLSACPDIKLLLNAAQFSPSGRRFGDYGERED